MLLGHLQDSVSTSQLQEICALQTMVQTRNQNNFDPANCSVAHVCACVTLGLLLIALCTEAAPTLAMVSGFEARTD